MGVTVSHTISRYYDYFRDREIIFTKNNLKALRIDPRQIYLKSDGGLWPCIINSSSLQMAKVFVGTSSGIYSLMQQKKIKSLSIRYTFFGQKNEPIQFFVNCIVSDIKPHPSSNELVIVTLEFTQRPPDDLIFRIGEFAEVNDNFTKRIEEKIIINQNSVRQLGLPKEETFVFITEVPRKCILKDISFGGATVMLVGIPKFLQEKDVDLRLFFTNTNEKVSLKGKISSANFLGDRKDICVCHITYIIDEIPMTYKFHINSFITSFQKVLMERQSQNKTFQKEDVVGKTVLINNAVQNKEKAEKEAEQQKNLANKKLQVQAQSQQVKQEEQVKQSLNNQKTE